VAPVQAVSEILSQSEIEALLSSLGPEKSAESTEEDTPVATGPSAPAAPKAVESAIRLKSRSAAYEVYDFRRPDKFSKDQLRTLQMLHETFARLAGSSLSAYLRSTVSVDLISLEQVPYEEYMRCINQSAFTIMSIPPLNGQAVLEMEFAIVFTMLDKLLGGPGRVLERSVLTEIEQPLVRQMVERMFGALKSAWEGVVIVNPGIEGMETSPQFVQIAPPTDIVISVLFEVRVGETRGAMSLCIPYMVLKPVTAKLSAQKWFANSNRKQHASHRRALTHQIQASFVECTVRLGRSKMHVKDFLNLQQGDIVRLDQRIDRDIRLFVSRVPKFEGRPALESGKLVFQVSGPYVEI
jgi:flagellar motor switch protein FliM